MAGETGCGGRGAATCAAFEGASNILRKAWDESRAAPLDRFYLERRRTSGGARGSRRTAWVPHKSRVNSAATCCSLTCGRPPSTTSTSPLTAPPVATA